jgi:Fe-S cluster assembly iron-binding protein IscA
MLASVGSFLLRLNSPWLFRSGARRLRRAISIPFLLSAAGLAGCAGLVSSNGNLGQALINILFSSSTLTIQTSQSHSFSVTVQNDPKNLGVSWSLSGSGCSGASCGTFTNSTSTSVTYNAPAQVPNPSAVSLIATSLADPSRSAAATIILTAAPQPITVIVTPASLSVQASTAANFGATLQNDSQNQGVSWSLSGSGCSGTSCGTLTNVTATSVTYDAPSAVPSPALVTLTATSNADKTKSATSSITITSAPQPISVAVNPPSISVQVAQSSSFSAILQNDAQNKGVTWSLSGSGCSGATCGTLTNITTSSVTYNAPAALPNPASLTLKATSIADTTKSGSSTITVTAAPLPISVAVNPPSTSVQVSATAPFSATLQNDTQNKGVTWSLSGAGCSGASCGTLTNVTTASVTYTAPVTVPSPASVSLKATSIADTTKSATASITVAVAPTPISVSINPSSTSAQVSTTTPFSASLQNDTQNKGVTWSLSGAGCSGASCGTLTNVTTTTVIYNAPASIPSPASVTLKATSIADTTKSGSATITVTSAPLPISVTINPSFTSVQLSTAADFSATLQNDSQNKGVTWSLSGTGCSGATCGTLTNVTTTTATYNAPATAPSPAAVTLKATSIADATKSGSSAITLTAAALPISVAVNPASTSVQVSATANFSATLQNDSQNKGVTWSLSGTGCSGVACGSLTNVTTTTVTYNAPATPPSPASVTLKGTSITDTTKSGSATITLTAPPPSAPANLTATANGSSQIDLSWSAATDLLGISAYLVERCQGANCSNFTQVASTASPSFNDAGLAASTSYSYRVRAEDPANNLGPYSSTAAASTDASSGGGSTPTFVWSKSAANTTGLNINSYISNLPTSGTLAGNVVIATFQYAVGSGASAAVKDDKGDTFALLASNSNGNQTVATYCAAPTTGARVLTITFSGGSPAYVAMINASEWYNLTCTLDGTSTNSSSSASVSAGSITTTSDGDLIYQAAEEDGNTGTEQWTPGASPWSLLSACSGLAGANIPQAAQFQVQPTHGSISPTFSMSAADSWNSIAVALKAASVGTAPPAGIRILHLQEEAIPTGLGGSITVQFPSSGNLLIDATIDCPDCDITGISDSNHNTHASTGPALNNSLSGSVQTFYAANAITSNNLSLTFTLPGSPAGGSDFFLFDVTGAAASPLDSTAGHQTATGDFAASSGSGTSTVNGPSITPSTPNGLIITQIAVDTNTIGNVSNGLSSVFFAGSIPNPIGQTNPLNENNGWAFDFNATTASRQYVWSTIGVGVNFWASTAVAFKAQ